MVEKKMWMVRAGEDAFLFDVFKNKNLVAIGWKIGDISKISKPEEIKNLVKSKYTENSLAQIIVWSGQINRFRYDFKNGDRVVTYNPNKRIYLIGEIVGDYEYDNQVEYHHIRKVKWLGEVSRDKLSVSTKNTLGAISTIFEISDDAQRELMELLKGKEQIEESQPIDQQLDILKEDYMGRSRDFIKDKILTLNWEEMQELVAGVLRGMGYKTVVSSKGADRGKDIMASPDGLGLEEPKILVEVKHRSGQMGSKEIRSFIAVLRDGEKGLYVSTGGFSSDAKLEADRSKIPVTLIDSDMLVNLIIQYYDKFDMDTIKLVPLTKIYWPT
jgi:restriction system protein